MRWSVRCNGLLGSRNLQGSAEMEAGCFQALILVEAVSIFALFTGVEVNLVGTLRPCKLSKPR